MRLAKRLSVIAATVALAGGAAMQPASAAQLYTEYYGTQVRVDNDPGDGAASWIWVYGSTEQGATGTKVEILYSPTHTGVLGVGPGEAAAIDLPEDVQAIDIYNYSNNGDGATRSTGWLYL
ncbi:hypothetical protein ACFQ51_55550 [Streptomyces kaempferi]